MAASDARPVPQSGVAFRVYFALRYLDGRLDTGWVNPSGFISRDGAAFANVTNNPVEVGGRGCGYCDLTATEMTADAVTLILQDTKAIIAASPNSGIPLVLTFYPEQIGDYRINPPSIASAVWDQQVASNVTTGSFGKAINDASGNVIPTVLANTVWSRAVSSNITAGSFGDALNQASGTILRQGATGAGLTAIPTITNVSNLINFPSGAIADAVWDEQINTHAVFGTAGRALTAASGNDFIGVHASPTNITAGTIANVNNLINFPSGAVADAVWDEQINTHAVFGTAGRALTAASGNDFIGVHASPTNITGGTITTVNNATNLTNMPSGAIAQAVWDRQVVNSVAAGTFGQALNVASGNTIAAVIANSIWSRAVASNITAGSMGDALNQASGILLRIGATGTGLTAIPTIGAVSNLLNFPSGAIADAIWDEAIDTHQVFGTAARALMSASGNVFAGVLATPTNITAGTITNLINMPSGAIAEAVWNRQVSGSIAAGTFGDALNQASGVSLRQGATGTGLSAIPTIATVTNLTNAPTNGDFTATMKTSIGTAVWTTPATRTVTGGTVDNLINLASGAIADAIWDEVLSQHQVNGTAGHALNIASGQIYGDATLANQTTIINHLTDIKGIGWSAATDSLEQLQELGNGIQTTITNEIINNIIDVNVVQVSGQYVSINDFATPVSMSGGATAAEVWSYGTRMLTSFPSGAFAEAVWNEQVTNNIYDGTFGNALNIASGILLQQTATGAGLTAIPTITNVTNVANLTNFPSGAVADLVWDEILGQHQVIGSTGYALNTASGNLIGGTTLTAEQVWTYSDRQLTAFPSGAFADAIWDEVIGQHRVEGSAGYALIFASGNLIGAGTSGAFTPADIWSFGSRTLSGTVNANIVTISGIAVSLANEFDANIIKVSGVPVSLSDFGGSSGITSVSGIISANVVSISGVPVNIDSSSVADSQELNTLGDLLLRRARIIRLIP